MTIGGMNHPRKDPLEEIAFLKEIGLDFIDFTMEPPGAAPWSIDSASIRSALDDHGLGVVGHTAYYLPIGHPYESVRRAASEELMRCADLFAQIGCRFMNVHPDRHAPFHDREFTMQQNAKTLMELIEHGRPQGVEVMLENVPGDFNSARQLAPLMDGMPELWLHLDIGHCNIGQKENSATDLIHCYGERLAHVHLHDNNGHADLHQPLGSGRMDWKRYVRELKQSGYDSTITLEVFTEDKHYLRYSRDVLREAWNAGD